MLLSYIGDQGTSGDHVTAPTSCSVLSFPRVRKEDLYQVFGTFIRFLLCLFSQQVALEVLYASVVS